MKLYPSIITFILLFILFNTSAQTFDAQLFKNMKARSIGPGAMSGRITAIDAVQNNADIIYAGAASGGVWKTENGGTTWTSIFDENPILNIGAIAIQQTNPSVVWVGTGEGNPRNSVNLGAGIYRSLDAGKTWKCMGLEKTMNIHRIIIDPNNPNTIYVGAIGNPFADHPERGVFKTTDGGTTWEKILFTNNRSGVADMVIDPSNPNKIIVAMWEHHRNTYNFTSGGEGSGLYITHNGGKNWTKLNHKTNGIPEGTLGRMGLAIAKSDPNRIYALIESSKNALYKSNDGGIKWEMVNDSDPETIKGNRPFYFWDLAVDPQNENRVYGIFQMISVSEDAGKSFKVIVPYEGVHPDHHAFWINPSNPRHIINGNDGGIAISKDKGKSWTYSENLPIGQFYHVNVDDARPYKIYGGLQDNGSWVGPSYNWQNGPIRSWQWYMMLGGDGFDVVPDPENNRFGYAMSQGGNLARYDIETGANVFIRPTAPDLTTRLRYNWNAALAIDPQSKATIYYGSQFVHKSNDKGDNWEIISPDLTTNNKAQQKAADETGGLTLDVTSAENHNTILTIAPSGIKQGVLWVGTDDGQVQLTKDGGKTWENLTTKIAGLPKEAWIPQIRASSYQAGEAFVVANNYRQGDMGVYVFHTTDYGQTWKRIVDDTKVKGYALCVEQDPVQPKLIFVGTEQGLWVSVDAAQTFTQWKNGIPSVSTMDMAIQKNEGDLVIATFGRGIYVLDNIEPLRTLAQNTNLNQAKILAYKSPIAVLANYRDADGALFSADANYKGENRAPGAKLGYFFNNSTQDSVQTAPKPVLAVPDTKGKKAKKSKVNTVTEPIKVAAIIADSTQKKKASKADSVWVKIYNSENKLIRTLMHKPDSVGYQSIHWDLAEAAMRRPGTAKPKKPEPDRGGQNVDAGVYKIVFESKIGKDSTQITVIDDPRVKNTGKTGQKALLERIKKSNLNLVEATDRLKEAEETVKLLQSQTKDKTGKPYDELNKASKAILDSIKVKNELILGKKFEKQGYGRPYQVTPVSKTNEAMNYITSRLQAPSKSDEKLVIDLEQLTKDVIGKINQFFGNDWTNYRKLVEANPIQAFKDYKPIED